MKTRHAALIRKGILAARDPELSQYVHLAPRLVREACRQEIKNIYYGGMLATRKAEHARRFNS